MCWVMWKFLRKGAVARRARPNRRTPRNARGHGTRESILLDPFCVVPVVDAAGGRQDFVVELRRLLEEELAVAVAPPGRRRPLVGAHRRRRREVAGPQVRPLDVADDPVARGRLGPRSLHVRPAPVVRQVDLRVWVNRARHSVQKAGRCRRTSGSMYASA